jgi:hypothetical protein
MSTFDRPFGRYFEEFEVGDVYKHWPGKTITEADDHLFCMITMNHHPLHTNAWFAEHETVHHKERGGGQPRLFPGSRHERARRLRLGDRESRGRDADPSQPDLPRRHDLRRDSRARRPLPRRSPTAASCSSRPRGSTRTVSEVCYFRRKVMVWKREFAPNANGLTVTTSGSNDLRRVSTCASSSAPSLASAALDRAPRPWAVLVSEVMLQQTQVSRVVNPGRVRGGLRDARPRARRAAVERARLWAGLGYHRRAKALHDAARMIRDEFGGQVPARRRRASSPARSRRVHGERRGVLRVQGAGRRFVDTNVATGAGASAGQPSHSVPPRPGPCPSGCSGAARARRSTRPCSTSARSSVAPLRAAMSALSRAPVRGVDVAAWTPRRSALVSLDLKRPSPDRIASCVGGCCARCTKDHARRPVS